MMTPRQAELLTKRYHCVLDLKQFEGLHGDSAEDVFGEGKSEGKDLVAMLKADSMVQL